MISCVAVGVALLLLSVIDMWKLKFDLALYCIMAGVVAFTLAVVINKCWVSMGLIQDTSTDTKYRKLESQHFKLHSEKGQVIDPMHVISLPQYICVMVLNYDPLQTIFAIPKGECQIQERRPDEQFSPIVTIVDAATKQTLNCVLLLQGEKPPDVSCWTLFCYIAVQVTVVPFYTTHDFLPCPPYHTKRKTCKEGQLQLIFCFHQADVNCLICLSIHSIADSAGMEYNHHSGDFTCFVRIIDRIQSQYHHRGVTRAREPQLIRYTGSLASKKYHKIAQKFEMISPQAEDVRRLARQIFRSNLSDDIKVIALCWDALIDIHGNPKFSRRLLNIAWRKASQMECENSLLLQGRVLRHFAHFHCVLNDYEKATAYITSANVKLTNAAHGIETASLLYTETLVQSRRLSSTTQGVAFFRLYESTERNYELLLKHSEFMEEYEKYRLYLYFTERAKLHLRSVLITDELPPKECWPSQDDLEKARTYLNEAYQNRDQLPYRAKNYPGNYYLTLSDLYLWKKMCCKANEYAEKAKQLFTCEPKTQLYTDRTEKRLKLLKKKLQ